MNSCSSVSFRGLRFIAVGVLLTSFASCQNTGLDDVDGQASSTPLCADRPITNWVSGGGLCLAVETHGVETAGETPTLIVLLHGDISRGGPADYHLRYARELGMRRGVVAVGMIRPGYDDGRGNQSTGSHHGRRLNYTEQNNRAVAEGINALKAHYSPRRTIVIGHSGGAVQLGVGIGRYPGLADAAILISCPCDLARFGSMNNRTAPIGVQSPSAFARAVPSSTSVVAITGDRDDRTPPVLGREYVASLQAHGVSAKFINAPGLGHHDFNGLWSIVQQELGPLMR